MPHPHARTSSQRPRTVVWIGAAAGVILLATVIAAAVPREPGPVAPASAVERDAGRSPRSSQPSTAAAVASSDATTPPVPSARTAGIARRQDAPPPATSRGERYRYQAGERTFHHTRSLKTTDAYSGVAVTMSTTGLALTGEHDFHEMSLTLYAPGPYSNGEAMRTREGRVVPMPATLAVAIGRSSGYDSFPGETIHDGKLYAYLLSTYCAAEAERNHQFLYWGGTTPVEVRPGAGHRVELRYSGESRWVPYADAEHPPTPGRYADWADRKGHRAYRWTVAIDGDVVAECWLNAPTGHIKYECNKVRPERTDAVNRFSDVRVQDRLGSAFRPIDPRTRFPATSSHGAYDLRLPSAGDVTFTMTRR